ncbi:MAG: Dabb family protein [Clostridia bacterium]|nr:Dabb family protein [Clostridia bacterium]MBR3639534.1 Dabb family protein [Clostridia bacterium]
MIRHTMMWKLKSGVRDPKELLSGAKDALDGLEGKIEGLEEISVSVSPLTSSSADGKVECVFRDKASLEAYKKHPAHAAAAAGFIKPYAETILSFDEEI